MSNYPNENDNIKDMLYKCYVCMQILILNKQVNIH